MCKSYVYRKLSPEFAFIGHSTKTYRNFSNFNRENFRRDISRQDWSCTSDDPNVLWDDWKAKSLSIVNSHAPIKTKRVRSGKVPWITSTCGRVCAIAMLLTESYKSNSPQNWAMCWGGGGGEGGRGRNFRAAGFFFRYQIPNGPSLMTQKLLFRRSQQRPTHSSLLYKTHCWRQRKLGSISWRISYKKRKLERVKKGQHPQNSWPVAQSHVIPECRNGEVKLLLICLIVTFILFT